MLKPKTTATRESIDLDGLWRFAIGTGEDDRLWDGPLPGELEAPVPSSYNDLFIDPAIGSHVGWVWYQRRVRVPRGWTDRRVALRFDSATHAAKVYVDRALVAEHIGGYLPFEADLTDVVSAGEEFLLTVGVSNELTNVTIPPGTITVDADGRRKQTYLHDFYNYAGLARSVRLTATPMTRVTDITIVTGFEGDRGTVDYTVDLEGDAEVTAVLRDANGSTVATADGERGQLSIDSVTLWRPGAAYLYELTIEARIAGEVVDEYPLSVGVRTVEVRGAEFLINGEPFYFTGFGKHEDTPVRGKGHDDAYMVHDFELLNWVGANSFRTSHYPYAEEVLDYADRHGIVIVDETAAVGLNLAVTAGLTGAAPRPTWSPETFGVATRDAHAQHLRELVTRDKNHPSVVMWSIANEPSSQEEGAREYFAPLVELTRELDPTRPVTYAIVMFALPDTDRIADLFDVLSLNRYYGWYVDTGDLDAAEKKLEAELRGWAAFGKPMMMSEYGADTVPGLHSVIDMPWTEEYQVRYLAMNHAVFDRIPEFVGEHVWNFADFRTGPGIHRVDGNKKGVFTRDRRPKAAAHALRTRWTAIGSRKPARPVE